jgi:AraC-like DNA-binding protein
MVRPILILTLPIWGLKWRMRTAGLSSLARAELLRLRAPHDYFAETRSSLKLQPERILCFVRKGRSEVTYNSEERHHHHRYVLIVPWCEMGEVHVDGRRFLLKHPEVLLIFPFQLHHGFKFTRSALLWQFVTFEIKEGSALDALRLAPIRKLKPEDFDLLSILAKTWNEPDRRDELADWLALILKRMLKAPSTARKGQPLPPTNSSSLLRKINQHCLLNLHRLFGLKELAAHLSVSESHLRASFRRETGMSLGHHIRRLRLQKAISLLLQSDLSITQVAERCGFDSIFTFSRSFHRFTGLTARDYRRRLASRARNNRKS